MLRLQISKSPNLQVSRSPGLIPVSYRRSPRRIHAPPFDTPYSAKHPHRTLGPIHIPEGLQSPYFVICSHLDSGAGRPGRPAVRHASPRPLEHASSSLNAHYSFESKFRSPPTSTPFEPPRNTLARRECKGEYPFFPTHPTKHRPLCSPLVEKPPRHHSPARRLLL
jgi:hypothetical protein